jgi:hypothetical protein
MAGWRGEYQGANKNVNDGVNVETGQAFFPPSVEDTSSFQY